ncbi:MAG: DUF1833 family protein [Syntrophorhabdaceae bacterium]
MSVSLDFRTAVYKAESERYPIALITISHADLASDILISTDATQRLIGAGYTDNTEVVYGTVSRGNNYIFFPLKLSLPDDTDEGPGNMTIEIDNIHRTLVETIRSIFTPAEMTVELVLDNALDTIEAQWPAFQLTNIKYDANIITGTLSLELEDREPFPAGSFTPSYFRGLFGLILTFCGGIQWLLNGVI